MLKSDLQTQEFATSLRASSLTSLRRFRADMGVVPSTAWRWIQRGWLDQPLNVGGRQYLTAEMICRFQERAARGEFAGGHKPPSRVATPPDQVGGAA
jgi:hypothetical protein